jgi:hypothetical protein
MSACCGSIIRVAASYSPLHRFVYVSRFDCATSVIDHDRRHEDAGRWQP